MNKIRINKVISNSGYCSRRKADELILTGRVRVNEEILLDVGRVVDLEKDKIYIDNEKLLLEQKVYYVLNKPKGYISTVSDERDRKKIVDLINTNLRIYPVGRLDKDTTGIIFLTNDGEFANFLLHPKNRIERIYEAILDKDCTLDPSKLKKIKLEDGVVNIDKLFINPNFKKRVFIHLHEGKNRIVKRIFYKLGYEVSELKRINYAGVGLSNLKIGNYRKLSYIEIHKIYKNYGKKSFS